jgi:multicomponent Na+:H+ antiporter subunit G
MLEIIGVLFLWLGVIFCAIGVLGVMRFRSVFSRLHAAGVISTLGLGGILLGAALLMPEVTLKLIILGVFVLITSPAATQAIARTARSSHVVRSQSASVTTNGRSS